MKNRYMLLSFLIVLATLAATAWVYGMLPDQVPTHWNARGDIDRHGSRAWVFTHPVFMLVFAGVWLVLPRLSPRRFTVEGFTGTWWFCGLLIIGLLAYIQGVILWSTVTGTADMMRAILGGLCGFSIVLGNVIGKVRRNFWLGIRTPWTLASERVWYATHRMAAKSMVIAGLIGVAFVIAGVATLAVVFIFMAGLLVPAAWSLVYYKRLERRGGLEA